MGEILKIPAAGTPSQPLPPYLDQYDYGAPAGSGGTTGGGTVVAQWIFEESSGDAIDEANGISVPASGTIPRDMVTPTFKLGSVGAATGPHRFTTTTDPTAMNLGTDSFVVELTWLFNVWANTSEHFPFDCRQTASGTAGVAFSVSSDGTVIPYIECDDGTSAGTFWASVFTANTLPTDGIVKMRFIIDRSGSFATIQLVYNGVAQAVKNLTAITSAKTISPTAVHLGGRYDNFRNTFGILKEIRVTKGTTIANSGGPGGG